MTEAVNNVTTYAYQCDHVVGVTDDFANVFTSDATTYDLAGNILTSTGSTRTARADLLLSQENKSLTGRSLSEVVVVHGIISDTD